MQLRSGKSHKLCLSLQQWAFLFSIITFVITAVLTTCAALGQVHTQNVWELIKTDLNEEEEKAYDNKHHQTNEAKLQLSQHFVLMIIWILYVCTWVGCLNLSGCVLMIYGIATKNSAYIIPWVITGCLTYLVFISTVLFAYLDQLPGIYISFNILIISLGSSTIFIIFWYTILLYYSSLTTSGCSSRYPKLTPTIVQAYGGYMHTVKSPEYEKKQIV